MQDAGPAPIRVPPAPERRRIAIVGSGISGLLAAHLLHARHDITLFEKEDRLGGHTNTIEFERWGRRLAVDTGFIVCNRRNYPIFTGLLDELGVQTRPTTMSFSVRCDRTGFEYGGSSLNALFAQRRRIASPRFWRMVRNILKFGREAPEAAAACDDSVTLGDFLDASRYSDWFIERYILPMGGAIWSASRERIRDFPFRAFVHFFENHGMLLPGDRPQWLTIEGGSQRYVEKLAAPWKDRIRTGAAVKRIERDAGGVTIKPAGGDAERFDEVVLAVHSDQALRLLADPTEFERMILGAIPYQSNEAVLHTDASLLPRRKLAWCAWNHHLDDAPGGRVGVTYCMNKLQGVRSPEPVCVTLNRTERIDPRTIIATIRYDHPVYSRESFEAQRRIGEISGENRTHYCGAWCGYGFHEDGARSAVRVAQELGVGAGAAS
ncbi:MAG: FAD-dependent oxidoreductase [Phycisphaeraceae bacterium]|nr:MAG: FAD-dependent oxidoreductase [Phycisphaeraceae bacterium]